MFRPSTGDEPVAELKQQEYTAVGFGEHPSTGDEPVAELKRHGPDRRHRDQRVPPRVMNPWPN